MEEKIKRLRKERDQLNQERACALESERKVGEELKTRSRKLAGRTRFLYCHSMLLTVRFVFYLELVTVLKANAKKHVEDLVKDRDSWKTNCIKL